MTSDRRGVPDLDNRPSADRPERRDRHARIDHILRDRANVLAARDDSEGRETEELATFSINGYTIGVPLAQVSHAATLQHITEIPGGPPWLVGLTTVESGLVSLLHLPIFVGLQRRGITDLVATLVAINGEREIGLAADQLLGIEDVPRQDISTMPAPIGAITRVAHCLLRTSNKPSLTGAKARELLLLDVAALFADPRLGRERR